MADLGSELWKHPDDGKTAALRLVEISFTARCASRSKCTKRATILIEGHDPIGVCGELLIFEQNNHSPQTGRLFCIRPARLLFQIL